MQPANFYTENLYTETQTGNILTANLKTYNVDTFTSAYWLGWISWDNIPEYTHFSTFSATSQNVTFYDVTKKQNANIGYAANGSYTLGGFQYGDIAKKEENAHITTISNMRFANKLDIMSIGSRPLLFLRFNVSMESSTDGGETWTKYGLRQIPISNVQGFDFLFNDSSVTIQAQPGYGGASETFDLKLSEIGENNVWWFDRPAEYQGTAYLNRFGISIYDFYMQAPLRDINSSGQFAQYIGASPFIDLETDEFRCFTSFTGLSSTYGYNEIRLNSGSGTPQITALYAANLFSNFGVAPGGFNFSVPIAWMTQTIYRNQHLYTGNALLWNRSSYTQAFRVLSPDEIKKTFCLQPYIWVNENVGRTYGYTENYSYVSYVTDENEFTATLITGTLEDDEFKSKLRLWQYDATEWEENDYTEDDKPEYEPEPTDEDPFGGSNWLTNSFPYGGTDGFVTQYVLTESQLQSFGANLWAKFFTQDFWESICVILPESLSINASDILNYVVSLREYPFDVTAVGNCASDDPIIFIGRGIVGVTVTGNAIHRMLEYNGHISIESNPIESHFGDFRDYEPCTRITLFVPFCGVVELTPSQVIGGTITLRYSIDFSTGAIQCTVQVNRGAFTTNLNTLSGTVGANVQMSASNLTQVLQKGAGMVANFAKSTALFAIGMGEVGAAEGAIASAESEQEIANAVGKYQHGASTAQSAFSVPDLNGVPVPVFGQSGGFASFQITEPMIQRTYHYYELPSNYAHVYGYACNKTVTLSSLEGKGFTVCKNVDLSGIPATQDELNAIESLLTSGVYF